MVLRILRLTRHAGWLALLGACATVSACSNNPAPVPQAFIAATVGVGPMSDSRVCNFATLQQWLEVGTGVGSKTPDTQTDGSNQGGAKISVACTVSASGSGFDIDLSVTQDGTQGGSVTITSPGGTGAVTQSGGTGITGVFESATNGRYRETDCTIAFTYMGQPVVTQGGPLAAGRIWGHISCPTAQVSGQTVMVDGGTQDVQCDAEADFLFEQCGL
jgi:hypothetical protein